MFMNIINDEKECPNIFGTFPSYTILQKAFSYKPLDTVEGVIIINHEQIKRLQFGAELASVFPQTIDYPGQRVRQAAGGLHAWPSPPCT